ncbi:hypothetical protein AQJ67_07260 [Streptomyces caeruleatus]|uniref:Uncharacterized protein n=1 Tax=Streptomyces caeruleatus TaxID=661399 RepID=A0A101U6T2_9ACTN|nr:hypothetical protein AQJ67_07260 [Streptomyces caeruleatus]
MRALCTPPRRLVASDLGTFTRRSCTWYMNTVPCGIRCETTARATTTPLTFRASTQSLSATPIASASATPSQMTFECGVR